MKTETEVERLTRLRDAGIQAAKAEKLHFLRTESETAPTPQLRAAFRALLQDELGHVERIEVAQ